MSSHFYHIQVVRVLLSCLQSSMLPVNFSAGDLWFTAVSLFCRLASTVGRVRRRERLPSLRPQSCLKVVSKLSQNWVKVESKLSQRAAGCVRTQEGDCRLPDLASRAAAGQCYRCQSATAATNTVLQVLKCYSRVLTRCFCATVRCYRLLPATTCTVKPTWQKCRSVELCKIQHVLGQFWRWNSELRGGAT